MIMGFVKILETPVMDRLMKDGIQFTRFYTAAACAPTRASLRQAEISCEQEPQQ